jgi:hypothetical protein
MPRSPKSPPPEPVRLTRQLSGLSFQHVSGSFIQLADSEPVAFPGPLQRNGSPAPHMLQAFIQQCQLKSQQPRMSAGDWNNLGYAYASLPSPNLQSAGSAFVRAQALTRDEPLLLVIQHNLRVVTQALAKAATPGISPAPQRPPKQTLPLPNRAYTLLINPQSREPLTLSRLTQPIPKPRGAATKPSTPSPARKKRTPKAAAPSRGKKPGAKGRRK